MLTVVLWMSSTRTVSHSSLSLPLSRCYVDHLYSSIGMTYLFLRSSCLPLLPRRSRLAPPSAWQFGPSLCMHSLSCLRDGRHFCRNLNEGRDGFFHAPMRNICQEMPLLRPTTAPSASALMLEFFKSSLNVITTLNKAFINAWLSLSISATLVKYHKFFHSVNLVILAFESLLCFSYHLT